MSQATQSQGKKRKRAQASDAIPPSSAPVAGPSSGVIFKNVNLAEGEVGPVFASGGALTLPANVPFNVYANKKKRSIMAGQTSKTEWQSTNHADFEAGSDEEGRSGYSCESVAATFKSIDAG